MSALTSLERFGEEDLAFINWRSCRRCLQKEWPLAELENKNNTCLDLKGAASNKKGFDNTTLVDNATFASEKLSAVSKDLSINGSWKYLVDSLERMKRSSENGRSRSRKEHTCDDSPNKNLCLPKSYSKFELPFTDSVNAVEIGIDIIDVLRINDKVSKFSTYICMMVVVFCKI